jgi:maltooligosyltrehalose trehalohydrolase
VRPAVWAPDAERVDLVHSPGGSTPVTVALDRAEGGWWTAAVELAHDERYGYSVDGGPALPDPRSLRQPDGVHELSAAYDHALFDWKRAAAAPDGSAFDDASWRGRALRGSTIYELHTGTFTPEGTFDAAIAHLDDLAELGIGHVEVLPVAGFDGPRGWGYDGVALYSVHEPYGGPDGLKRFVAAAHARGLAVLLDVVYNHLGPSGNYLGSFGPYFTDTHQTPWGSAVNLDAPGSDEVRRYLLDNALSWMADFHLDGLRLDAVHALVDDRGYTFLEELTERVDGLSELLDRPLTLIAESDRNDPGTVTPRPAGGTGLHGQWDDDIHHALHVALTGEDQGYYADFTDLDALRKVMEGAFYHDGTYSSFRGRRHGRPVPKSGPTGIPPWRFVASLQTHDQVGNRATGERLAALVSPGQLAAGAALLLLSPFTPMLFMGEEWAASTPWQYFTSFPDKTLGEAVSNGRRSEFGGHGWSADDVPDPQDPATRDNSVLKWEERSEEPHGSVLRWYRDVIALRTKHAGVVTDSWSARLHRRGALVTLRREGLTVVANLGTEDAEMGNAFDPLSVLLRWPSDLRFASQPTVLPGGSAIVVAS